MFGSCLLRVGCCLRCVVSLCVVHGVYVACCVIGCVRCLWLVVCRWLFVFRCVLCVVCVSSLAVRCGSFVVCCVARVVYCLLFVGCWDCVLFVVRWLMCGGCCLLRFVSLLSFVVVFMCCVLLNGVVFVVRSLCVWFVVCRL